MSASAKKTHRLNLPVPVQTTENPPLERLQTSASEDDYFRKLLFVVGFYRGIRWVDLATRLLRNFIETSNNLEQKAHCYLTLGQIAADEQRMEVALGHFRAALELNPNAKKIRYVLHNNAGYCLNRVGRYIEAERHSRMAIDIHWTQASGYRNLGVSLYGQGQCIAAAWVLVEAVKLDLSDDRARSLLEKLVVENPSVVVQCPWVAEGLNPGLETNRATPLI